MKKIFIIINTTIISVNVFGDIVSDDWGFMSSRNHNRIARTEINQTSPTNNQEVRGNRSDNRTNNLAGISQMLDNLMQEQQRRLLRIPYQSEDELRRVQEQLNYELEFLHHLLLEIRMDNNQLHRRFRELNQRRQRETPGGEENNRVRLRTISSQIFNEIQETRRDQSR